MIVAALIVAAVAVQQPPAVPPASTSDLQVVLTTAVYQPDGGISIETAPIPGTSPSVVHLYSRGSVCDAAMSGAAEPRDAKFGWRLAARPVRSGATDVVVSIDWLRVWDRGQRLKTGPSGTVQLTLHPGDRIPLDYIPNSVASDACRAVGLGLEIRLARTTAAVAPNSELIPLGGKQGGVQRFNADLWLVHRLPTGTEYAQHQRVVLTGTGGSFSFPAVNVPTANGEMAVDISGAFQRYRAPTGAEFMYVSMVRGLSGGALPAGGVSAGTGTMIAVPDPSEVLSLELPATAAGRGGRGGGAMLGGPRGGGTAATPQGAGGGGGGGARSRGGFVAGAPPVAGPAPTGATRAAGETAAQGGPATGAAGGARGTGIVAARGVSPAAEIAAALAGHTFSLRLRLTPQ
jgi:hypothetical protein